MAHGQPSYRLKDGEVQRRRLRGGMTLRALAQECATAGQKVSDSQLSKIERGHCVPRPQLLVALAAVFAVDVAHLVQGERLAEVSPV